MSGDPRFRGGREAFLARYGGDEALTLEEPPWVRFTQPPTHHPRLR